MNGEEVKERTPEQIRADMYKQFQEQQGYGQHLCEVATPGVIRNVNPADIDRA